jgi:HD-like signal output (HDOD) protein
MKPMSAIPTRHNPDSHSANRPANKPTGSPNDTLEMILEKIQSIPPLPHAVSRLYALADNLESDTRDLVQVISSDEALTSKILRVANSAFYGLSYRIGTISQALTVIGFYGIRDLALGVSVFGFNHRSGTIPLISREEFWKHSLTVALTARLLAQRAHYKNPEEAFTAGILHEVGRVVFLEYFTDEYESLLKEAASSTVPLHKLEQAAFGLDHAAVGRALCEHWRIPDYLGRVVLHHHQTVLPDELPPEMKTLVQLVQVADNMARIAQQGFSGNPTVDPFLLSVLDTTGKMPLSTLASVLQAIPEEIKKTEIFFNLILSPHHAVEPGLLQKPGVLLLLEETPLKAILTLMLLQMGLQVFPRPSELPAAASLIGVILDDATSCTLQDFPDLPDLSDPDSNLVRLNFTTWQQQYHQDKNRPIPVQPLEQWLRESLNL